MRWLNPSAVLNFRKPSMDFAIDKPGELRFIRNSSIFGKMSTAARRANEKPEPDGLWFTLSSGEWIRTTDLRVMSPTSFHCSTPHQELHFMTFKGLCQAILLVNNKIAVCLRWYWLNKPGYGTGVTVMSG